MKYKSWNAWIEIAEKVYQKEGSINVPAKYTIEGIPFGQWVSRQRTHRLKGHLKAEQIAALDSFGMKWDGRNILQKRKEIEFLEWINLVLKYKQKYGDTRIPNDYIMNGKKLGGWARNIRNKWRGKQKQKLSAFQIKMLDKIEFEFEWYKNELNDKWENNYRLVKEYMDLNPNMQISENVEYKGKNIGKWVHTQRIAYKNNMLSLHRKEKLIALGVNLTPMRNRWNENFKIAQKYYEECHNLDIPNDMIINGVCIGAWISNQRQVYNKTRTDMALTSEQIDRLNSIGMNWKADRAGNTSFSEQVLFYYLRKVFPDTENRNSDFGFELDIYVPSKKIAFEYDGEYWHRDKLAQDNEKDSKCEALNIKLIRIREKGLQNTDIAKCYIRNGTKNLKSLEKVYSTLFREVFNIDLNIDIKRDMFKITRDFHRFAGKTWFAFFHEAKRYYDENGDLLVPISYITPNGLSLGRWIAQQRQLYKKNITGRFSKNEVKLLEEIGMVWRIRGYEWDEHYKIAREYFREHGNLLVPRDCIYKNFKLGKWINTQRNKYNGVKGKTRMSPKQISMLEKIGMVWMTGHWNDDKWDEKYKLARDYYKLNGDLAIPKRYIINDVKLGEWLLSQRRSYKMMQSGEKSSMTEERITKLEQIGMIWRMRRNNS